MALKAALHNVKTGPYTKLAPLHIHVLMVTEQPRVIMWDFRSNTAIAKITKNNTVAVISDGESVTKVTLFEELSSKLVEGKNYIMKNYRVCGESPSCYILVTKNTEFYKRSPVVCSDGLIEEAKALLCPPSVLTNIKDVKGSKGLLTLEGKIVQLSDVKKVRSGREEVPLRELKLQQDKASITVILWREAAIKELEVSSLTRVTHLKANMDAARDCVHSTTYTKVETLTVSGEAASVEVLGVMESSTEGVMQLLLANELNLDIDEGLWEPYDAALEMGRVYVNIKFTGKRIIKIESVERILTE